MFKYQRGGEPAFKRGDKVELIGWCDLPNVAGMVGTVRHTVIWTCGDEWYLAHVFVVFENPRNWLVKHWNGTYEGIFQPNDLILK